MVGRRAGLGRDRRRLRGGAQHRVRQRLVLGGFEVRGRASALGVERAGRGVAWIAAGPAKSRLEGMLFSYRYLGDGRVNQSEGVVLRAGRAEKIAWYSKRWGGSTMTLTARRLDGTGLFRQIFRASLGAGWYPSGSAVPAAGCWELALRTDGWMRHLVVKAVDPAPEVTCDAAPGAMTSG